MFNLNDYQTAILAIAEVNRVTESDAKWMFVANIKRGSKAVEGKFWYEGAEEVDFVILNGMWNAMSLPEQNECINNYGKAV